jgi:hypothetical protein
MCPVKAIVKDMALKYNGFDGFLIDVETGLLPKPFPNLFTNHLTKPQK